MRSATIDDRPAIEAFLRPHAPMAMFPLANLARYGMTGDHPRSPRFWLSERQGSITDVLTVTVGGSIMPFLPSGNFREAADVLAGRTVSVMIGPSSHVRGLEALLPVADLPRTLDDDEPQFVLGLDRLAVPHGKGRIIPLREADQDIILRWIADYDIEALGSSRSDAAARAPDTLSAYVEADSHVALIDDDGTYLAMTGFNARLDEIVQIGGVWTPPALRGRGYARRAVGLHLAQARASGADRATLFASGPAAVAAYRALGFEQIGTWAMILFDGPQVIGDG